MPRHPVWCTLWLSATVLASLLPAVARDLSFDERVRAQDAIERVYHAHRIGEDRSFEDAVPREILEQRVKEYMAQSRMLELVWGTPVTGEMLRRESVRIAEETQLPERLVELYASLQWDPFVIEECLVRQVLVDRLTRNFFRGDVELQAPHRRSLDTLRARIAAGLTPDEIAALEDAGWERDEQDTDPGEIDDGNLAERGAFHATESGPALAVKEANLARARSASSQHLRALPPMDEENASLLPVVVDAASGGPRVAILRVPKPSYEDWFESTAALLDGRAVPVVASGSDTLPLERLGARSGGSRGEASAIGVAPGAAVASAGAWLSAFPERFPPAGGGSAIWTGNVVLFWPLGLRYDPATDSWSSISDAGDLAPRGAQCFVWTGRELLVWGNTAEAGSQSVGARYDPSTDVWTPVLTAGAPAPSPSCVAVWTGDRMIIWGSDQRGGLYDPAGDAWSPMSPLGGPAWSSRAVWTGSEMLIWNGPTSSGRYDPETDSWRSVSQDGAPEHRQDFMAIWSGSELIIWGGYKTDPPPTGPDENAVNTGARYDPRTDQWVSMSTKGAPPGGTGFAGVWTGSTLLLWGGRGWSGEYLDDTWWYEPGRDKWHRASSGSAPEPRSGATAVWTGSQMIIWGGTQGGEAIDTGGRYDPKRNRWTPTQTSPAPRPRENHTTVWTGNEMIVWGGATARHYYSVTVLAQYDTGGRFDPTLATWRPTSAKHAPSARVGHTAVWTGSRMLIWGGGTNDGHDGRTLRDGAEYDPIKDRWRSIPRTGGPSMRSGHAAIWTGREMIVWGGAANTRGDRYDPRRRTWRRVSDVGAPSGGESPAAVWTGTEMIVWEGGEQPGGRYDPTTDRWSLLPTLDGPGDRWFPSVTWTGSQLLVWGGMSTGGPLLDSGASYDPAADVWSAMPSAGAPSARISHSAVWTGDRLIVWGGNTGAWIMTNSGGVYDPVSSTWSDTSLENAPPARMAHSAIWIGDRMLVWGGRGECPDQYCDGGAAFVLDASGGAAKRAPSRRGGTASGVTAGPP